MYLEYAYIVIYLRDILQMLSEYTYMAIWDIMYYNDLYEALLYIIGAL